MDAVALTRVVRLWLAFPLVAAAGEPDPVQPVLPPHLVLPASGGIPGWTATITRRLTRSSEGADAYHDELVWEETAGLVREKQNASVVWSPRLVSAHAWRGRRPTTPDPVLVGAARKVEGLQLRAPWLWPDRVKAAGLDQAIAEADAVSPGAMPLRLHAWHQALLGSIEALALAWDLASQVRGIAPGEVFQRWDRRVSSTGWVPCSPGAEPPACVELVFDLQRPGSAYAEASQLQLLLGVGGDGGRAAQALAETGHGTLRTRIVGRVVFDPSDGRPLTWVATTEIALAEGRVAVGPPLWSESVEIAWRRAAPIGVP